MYLEQQALTLKIKITVQEISISIRHRLSITYPTIDYGMFDPIHQFNCPNQEEHYLETKNSTKLQYRSALHFTVIKKTNTREAILMIYI